MPSAGPLARDVESGEELSTMSDTELARFFLSLVLVLIGAMSAGHLFKRLRLPRVVGEICGGIILGPSVFGFMAPQAQRWVFAGFETQSALLSAFYWLGLVLLMFTAGFKVQTGAGRDGSRLIALLVIGAVVLPFAFGFLAAPFIPDTAKGDPIAFRLVVGIGAAVTSIPVISRLFIDLNLMGTRFARTVVTAAAIQDLILWAILAVATAIQQGHGSDPVDLSRVAVTTLVFAVLSFMLGPRVLRVVGRLGVKRFTEASLIGYTLLVCLAFVTIASLLDINVVFGAFVAGLVIGRFPSDLFEMVKQRIADLSLWFFVPIYFALVGLNLDLSLHLDWRLTLVFLAASTAVKLASVMLVARTAGCGWSEALDYGMAMNTRGGPGIVVASVGLASGIIDDRMFTALVLASLVTSLAAGLWFRWRRDRISLIRANAGGVPRSR